MRVKLDIDLKDGRGTRQMCTNLFVICEWEKTEGRKVSDGKGIGYSDLACWAYHLCKLAGDSVPTSWMEWIKQHPDAEIAAVDETNPNPTDAAPTVAI